MTLEMGKPLPEARGEIAYAAEFFRWFSEEAVRIDGGYSIAPKSFGCFLVMRQPVGPCLLITPWNFPMAMGTRKMACSGMHDGGETGGADSSVDAGPRRHPPGVRATPNSVLNLVTTSDPEPSWSR